MMYRLVWCQLWTSFVRISFTSLLYIYLQFLEEWLPYSFGSLRSFENKTLVLSLLVVVMQTKNYITLWFYWHCFGSLTDTLPTSTLDMDRFRIWMYISISISLNMMQIWTKFHIGLSRGLRCTLERVGKSFFNVAGVILQLIILNVFNFNI